MTLKPDDASELSEMKPCPFCGGEQVTASPCENITDDDRPEVTWAAICKACGARVDRDTEAEAIAAWNTRTLPLDGDVVEQLGEALFVLSDRLRASGILSASDKVHEAYEKVVAAFQAVTATRSGDGELREAREQLVQLALAAGELVTATDGMEALRDKRRNVLWEMKQSQLCIGRIDAALSSRTAE